MARWLEPGFTEAERNGSGDVSGKINAAVVAAADLGGTGEGGVVYLPAGRYRLDAGIVLRPRVTLRGDGAATILQASSSFPTSSSAMITAPTRPVQVFGLRLDLAGRSSAGIVLAGSSPPTVWTGGAASEVRDVSIVNVAMSGGTGVRVEAAWRGVSVRRVLVRGQWPADNVTSATGIWIWADDVLVRECVVDNVRHGFLVYGERARLASSKAFYCGSDPQGVAPGFELSGNDAVAVGCDSQDNVQGFRVFGDRVSLVGCVADGSKLEQFSVEPSAPSSTSAAAVLGCLARHDVERWTSGYSTVHVTNFRYAGVARLVMSGVSMSASGGAPADGRVVDPVSVGSNVGSVKSTGLVMVP